MEVHMYPIVQNSSDLTHYYNDIIYHSFSRLFIKSFEDGEYMYYEKFREHPTVTQNGKGAAIWNEIHTQISNNFVSDEFY